MPYIGNTVQNQGFTPAIDYFSGNGVTVTFTLSRPVVSVAQMIVSIDNVVQNPSSAYTVSGSSITFTSAPLSGTNNIWVEYTSLITTYAAISQSPSVIGDITASGGYLSTGSFGASFVDGTIVDYTTGNGRITVGPADGLTLYTGGTSARTALAAWDTSGNLTNTGTGSFQGVYIGKGAGSASASTAVGYQSLNTNTSAGTNNTAVGYQAAYSSTADTNTVAVGYQSYYGGYTGGAGPAGNTSIGYQAQYTACLYSNTAVGYQANYSNTSAHNTAVGYQANYTCSSAGNNTAIGDSALYANNGSSNTAVGYFAATANTSGTNNVAVGWRSLYSNTTGSGNTAVGYQAGYSSTVGTGNNTFIGKGAGYAVTDGAYNVILGSQDTTLVNGSYNAFIGRFANASSSTVSYSLLINTDNTSRTDKGSSTGFIFTGGSMYQGNNSSSWAVTSDQRLKKNIVDNNVGLEIINSIQVRNFEYRLPEEVDSELNPSDAVEIGGIQIGVIAQEFQQILPECVTQESTGVLSVDTDNLTWYLVNAVKELKAEVDLLKAQLEAK